MYTDKSIQNYTDTYVTEILPIYQHLEIVAWWDPRSRCHGLCRQTPEGNWGGATSSTALSSKLLWCVVGNCSTHQNASRTEAGCPKKLPLWPLYQAIKLPMLGGLADPKGSEEIEKIMASQLPPGMVEQLFHRGLSRSRNISPSKASKASKASASRSTGTHPRCRQLPIAWSMAPTSDDAEKFRTCQNELLSYLNPPVTVVPWCHQIRVLWSFNLHQVPQLLPRV